MNMVCMSSSYGTYYYHILIIDIIIMYHKTNTGTPNIYFCTVHIKYVLICLRGYRSPRKTSKGTPNIYALCHPYL